MNSSGQSLFRLTKIKPQILNKNYFYLDLTSLNTYHLIHYHIAKGYIMKPNIHPDYQQVAFHDTAADSYFIIGSTIKTSRTVELEGKTYPYVPIDVSSDSHPFYTGKQKAVASDGRVAAFNRRFKNLASK